MSYILDALRRADAERDRGNVPGIHAQGYGGPPPAGAAPATRPWTWLASGAVAVLVVGAAAWYLLTPVAPGAVAPPLTPPAVVAPAPPVALEPPAVAASPRAEVTAAARKPKSAAAPASATAATDARPSATAEKVYALSELPEDIRRQLPVLAVGGSMYSSKPADRLLILNGQVVHEGDKIGNDLVLQQIRLKSALLNFKGYRYTINF